MRTAYAALLAVSLMALPVSAQTFGLGLGASSPDSVDLKVAGKTKTFHVKSDGATPGAQAFLNCLVAGRIVKIEAGGSKLSMLDQSDIAIMLHEFSQSRTTIDPCDLGKAAYVPMRSALTGPAPAATIPATPPAAGQPRKHLGRTKSAAAVLRDDDRMKTLGAAYAPSGPAKPAVPAAAIQPAAAGDGLVVQSLGTAQVESAAPASAVPTLGAAGAPATTPSSSTENPKSAPATTTLPSVRPPL